MGKILKNPERKGHQKLSQAWFLERGEIVTGRREGRESLGWNCSLEEGVQPSACP